MKKCTLRLPLRAAYPLLAAASLIVSLFLFLIQPDTDTPVLKLILDSNGLTFLLNWLPVLLVMFLLFFLTARVVAAAGTAAVLFALPSVVNRYMIAMRHAPLQPLDLMLGAEFLGIAKSIRPAVFISVGVGALIFTALAVTAFKLVKNEKPGEIARLSGGLVCIGLSAALYLTVYAGQDLYDSLPLHGNRYSETDQFQSKGFVYSFIRAVRASRLTRPAYYGEYEPLIEEAQAAGSASPAVRESGPSGLPNIVIVQSEAFSELPLSPAVSFDGYDDPLANYKQIKEEALAGYAVAPHLGGGTADIEFDVLTGLNTRGFRGVPYTFKLITNPFPGVASAFKANGYFTVAMHPGAGWFYNRQNVYPLLGFDAFLDDRFYDTTDTKGLYITERQTVERLIQEFEARPSPRFFFVITIQNHGPYYGKYPLETLNYSTSLDLSEEDALSLANYLEGVKDSDKGLRTLTDYFSATDEPVALLYYGDHLPSFPPALLDALSPLPESASEEEAAVHYYRPPFLLWMNDTAKPLMDTRAFEESLPADRTVSAHYLGAALLEMAGIAGEPFLDYVNGLRAEYPVVLEDRAAPAGRENAAGEAALERYNSWAYYRIRG